MWKYPFRPFKPGEGARRAQLLQGPDGSGSDNLCAMELREGMCQEMLAEAAIVTRKPPVTRVPFSYLPLMSSASTYLINILLFIPPA